MKATLAVFLLCAALVGQSQYAREANWTYPFTLTVLNTQHSNRDSKVTTQVTGYLSDDPEKQLHLVCDGGISTSGSKGKAKSNTYPARYGEDFHHIKIQVRDIGSDKVRECACTY